MELYLSGTAKVHLMCGFTDMHNGVNGLFSLANNILSRDGLREAYEAGKARRG
jgi:hypothetical protein